MALKNVMNLIVNSGVGRFIFSYHNTCHTAKYTNQPGKHILKVVWSLWILESIITVTIQTTVTILTYNTFL